MPREGGGGEKGTLPVRAWESAPVPSAFDDSLKWGALVYSAMVEQGQSWRGLM